MPTLNEKFATNLKKARIAKKLTQVTLAKKCGFSVSYQSMLERGQRSPPLDTLEKVAKGLGVSVAALLT